MIYLVRTVETQVWKSDYLVEADSADEAINNLKNEEYLDVSTNLVEISDREINEIEPYNDETE